LLNWGVNSEGSSRTSALIRIGLVLLLWGRYAGELLPFFYPWGWQPVFCVAFFAFSTLMLVGVFSQATTLVTAMLALSLYWGWGHYLGVEPYTHHHTYLVGFATLLCALTPCGRSYSVDRWWAVRKARLERRRPRPERGNLLGLRLMVIQMSAIYFWSAYDKSFPGFLEGDRLEHLFVYYYVGSDFSPWAEYRPLFCLVAWIVVLMEYLLAFGLPFAKTRKYLLAPGLILHAIFYLMLPVYTYSATMVLLYLAYVNPDRIHSLLEKMSNSEDGSSLSQASASEPRG
jgi:hypothetical protein